MEEQMKRLLKSTIMWIDWILMPILLPMVLKWKGIKLCHLSFDDVTYTVDHNYIYISNTIEEILRYLDNIRIQSTVYLYKATVESVYTSNLLDIPSVKIGLHLPSMFLNTILCKFINTRYIRFHEYKATYKDIKMFKQHCNLKAVLLCCHDNKRISYDLTLTEQNIVNKKITFEKNGVSYIKTDIRFERPICLQILSIPKGRLLTVFAHEWAIDLWRNNLFRFIYILKKQEIKFIS